MWSLSRDRWHSLVVLLRRMTTQARKRAFMSKDILINKLCTWNLTLWTFDSSSYTNFTSLIHYVCCRIPLAARSNSFIHFPSLSLSAIDNLISWIKFGRLQPLICVRSMSLASTRSRCMGCTEGLLKCSFTTESVRTSTFCLASRPLSLIRFNIIFVILVASES